MAQKDFFSFRGSIKSNRRFSQKLIKDWEKAAEAQAVREYLAKEKRIRKRLEPK